MSMDLDRLVERFRKKDMKAFETLYGMYSENIMGAVNVIVKDDAAAEEITQDVFLKIWDKAHSYDPSKGRFFTWVLNIARNAAIDHWRSQSYKNQKKNLTADFFVDILASKDNLDKKVDAIGLKSLVSNLRTKCLEIIELLYFKGFTHKDAATELDIPIGTIKTRNRNCVEELRTKLGVS